MRVAIDTTPLVQTRAGTARHVLGLLGGSRARPGLELVGIESRGSGVSRRSAATRSGTRSASVVSPPVDVLHCTTFRAPLSPRAPLVVTVHDLGVLRHPEAFPRGTGTRGRSRSLGRQGRGRGGGRVGVPHPGRAGRPAPRPRGAHPGRPERRRQVFSPDGPAAEGDYVLAVGTSSRERTFRQQWAARLADVELRVAGAAGGDVAAPGWVGEPSDEELAALMRGARCVVYPSLYEGFGLPILEAMACSVPS